jgi:hypothetical protein
LSRKKTDRPPAEPGDDEATRPTVRPSDLVDPARSGSVDVAFSQAGMSAAPPETRHETSGSVDIAFSQHAIPAAKPEQDEIPVAKVVSRRAPTEASPARRRRATTMTGRIGESLSNLPVVRQVLPRSTKAQVLVRSVIVAFGLIASWIIAIILLQTRAAEKPDFRPQAEQVFASLRDGDVKQVYDASSERFQEMVLAERFEVTVDDMNKALGPFVEVAAVVDTETFRGASGRIGRVDLLLDFEKGRAPGSISFRWENGQWKMVGFWVELPEDVAKVETSEAARKKRVELPDEIKQLAIKILEQTRDGQDDAIWDAAHPDLFQASISKEEFRELQKQRRETLGPFRRLLSITSGKGDITGGGLDALIEFGNNLTITGTFRFSKVDGVYRLTFYKLIMPLPHAVD